MPQHTKMYFITPLSKMASWISLLCLPSLDCDTKQTHNKPSSTTQVRNYSQGQDSLLSKTISLSYLYKSRTQRSQFGGIEISGKVHFFFYKNEVFYSLTPSQQGCCCTHMTCVVGLVLWILLYPWGSWWSLWPEVTQASLHWSWECTLWSSSFWAEPDTDPNSLLGLYCTNPHGDADIGLLVAEHCLASGLSLI